jgi:hypothetical protein
METYKFLCDQFIPEWEITKKISNSHPALKKNEVKKLVKKKKNYGSRTEHLNLGI